MTENPKAFQPMTYEKAYNYAVSYGRTRWSDDEMLFQHRLRIKTDNRFRFNFDSIDMSFDKSDQTFIVRATIQRLSGPTRQDVNNALPLLTEKYKAELAEGYLEMDDSAMEVDGIKPRRLNLRLNFQNANISNDALNHKVENLLLSAVKWGNKYYLSVFNDINKKRDAKISGSKN